jgi:PadR family transcriptional regulator PadR
VRTFERPSGSGPVRRYYELTDRGVQQLAQFRASWTPFARSVAELIAEAPPPAPMTAEREA